MTEPQETASTSASDEEIRWAINVLLEKIAAKFEANPTWDIWRSDAAAIVRSFKHDLSPPGAPAHDLIGHDETMANLDALKVRR